MHISPLGREASTRPALSSPVVVALLLVASLSASCSDDDRDEPTNTNTFDSAVVSGDGSAGGSDASSGTDAGASDAGAKDGAAPMDSGGSGADAGMDATSPDASGSDAASDAAGDAAGDAASDASADGAIDGAAQDASADAASDGAAEGGADGWPVTGCDQSYRFLARNQSGGRYQVASGSHFATFTFDAPWNNQQVQAIAFRMVTDNGQIVKRMRLENAGTGEILTHFAAGDDDRTVLPGNVASRLPTGTRSMRLAVRYVNETGGNRTDASGIDVCIVRGARLRTTLAAVTKTFVAPPPVIPAHAENLEVTSTCTVNNVQPVYLLSAGPYAHEYAVWTKFTVTKESGEEIDMLHRAYAFDDRSVFYPLTPEPEVMIEQGDTVTTTCVFTNPSDDDLPAGSGGDTLEGSCFNLALHYPANTNVLNCTTAP